MKPCLLIPIFDHGDTIANVVKGLAPHGLPLLIVDDGSAEPTRAELERLVGQLSGVQAQLHAQVRRARAALKDSQAREQAAQSQLELARQATTLATEESPGLLL